MADHLQLSQRMTTDSLNRRTFLSVAGLAAGAVMLGGVRPMSAAQPPAPLRGTKLTFLQWVNFVPALDAVLKQQFAAWEKHSGVKVTLETINMNDIQARTTVAIENRAGPDIIQLIHNWPYLYEVGLEPVDDLAEELGQTGDGYYDLPKAHSFVNGRWRAVPYAVGSPASTYRTDWFKEVGYDTFPDTWQAYREAGKSSKPRAVQSDKPLGIASAIPRCFAMPCCGHLVGRKWSLTERLWRSIAKRRSKRSSSV